MKKIVLALSALLASSTAYATAGPNLVTNGDFELTVNHPGESYQLVNPYFTSAGENLDDWTQDLSGGPSTTNYSGRDNFVYVGGNEDTDGATVVSGNFGPGNYCVRGPGGCDGRYASNPAGMTGVSPVGGNFLALDADNADGITPISQMINGLDPTKVATLTFWWGGITDYNRAPIATSYQLTAILGSETLVSDVQSAPQNTFTGWEESTLTFMPTSASELLTFFAGSAPYGAPPQLVLDGISLTQELAAVGGGGVAAVPEPATWAMLLVGMGAIGVAMRRRLQGNTLQAA